MKKCPICRRKWLTTESLLTHLAEDHNPLVLAETLVELSTPKPCGKHQFPSKADAERALTLNLISANPLRRETRAYQCNQCNGKWHLTSQAAVA